MVSELDPVSNDLLWICFFHSVLLILDRSNTVNVRDADGGQVWSGESLPPESNGMLKDNHLSLTSPSPPF